MPFHDPKDRPYKDMTPEIRTRTFWGDNMLLSLVDLDANAVMPNHSHPHEQSSYVLEGELEFTLGEETRTVRPGDIVVIPSDMQHGVKVGPQPARVLDIFSPAREDLKY